MVTFHSTLQYYKIKIKHFLLFLKWIALVFLHEHLFFYIYIDWGWQGGTRACQIDALLLKEFECIDNLDLSAVWTEDINGKMTKAFCQKI